MVSLIQAVILSIVQGITEWFPVSSSGHLALLQHFFGFQNLSFDIFLHLASVLAIIVFFWEDLIKMFSLKRENLGYIFKILIALIPAGILGILFRDYIASLFDNLFFLGVFFIFSGIIIYATKFTTAMKKDINFSDSLFIGFFQAVALFPGISRSGMTISSGLFRALDRNEAVKFSFLLAIPVILGASFLETKNIISLDMSYSILLVSFLLTFITSLITIKFLINIVKHDKFYLFGWYNIVLGILVVVWTFII